MEPIYRGAEPPDKWISQTGTRGGKSQNNLRWSFAVTFQNLIWLKITHINMPKLFKKMIEPLKICISC